ncbi:Uncharacterised protein [Serratia fonticola]|uniref:Uncharacterized protein n=1 Tax=Serratia fonticola TaxID=47917 RepID=A0A3S5B802_SERFO|nr:Uncharacterised protein [Serratia fonticola]VEI74830.1 Uncharacterised protein [Serratia fonticola]
MMYNGVKIYLMKYLIGKLSIKDRFIQKNIQIRNLLNIIFS